MVCLQCGGDHPEDSEEQPVCACCSAGCVEHEGAFEGMILEDAMGEYDCPACAVPLTLAIAEGIRLEACESCRESCSRAGRSQWSCGSVGGDIVEGS